MKFIEDTLTTFSTQIIGVILGLAAAIVIAKVLGPSGKGAYTVIKHISKEKMSRRKEE